jgi:hypothetical protein
MGKAHSDLGLKAFKTISVCLLLWHSVQVAQSAQDNIEQASSNTLQQPLATPENWLLGSWIDGHSDCSRPAYNFSKTRFVNHTDVDGDPATFKSKVVEYQIKPPSIWVKFAGEYTLEGWRDANRLVHFRQTGTDTAEFVHPRPTAVNLQIRKCPIKTSRSKSKK